MENTYEFGKLEDKLFRYCRAAEPDFEKIEAVLTAGANVNAVNQNGRNLLSRLYHAKQDHGNYFPAITARFIQAGFDVKRFGRSCVTGLVFSSYDRFIVDTAKILFRAGVQLTDKELDKILGEIGTEESYQRCCDCNHALENIYYAFYEVVSRAGKGMPFEDVVPWQDCIGKTVQAVFGDAKSEQVISPLSDGRYAITDQLFFDHGDTVTLIEANPNIFGCAMPQAARHNSKDLGELFSAVIGAKIKGIYFKHHEIQKGDTGYRQPVITISFDNGCRVRFSTNFGEVPKEETRTYFEFLKATKERT